ncbi:hypothetical protein SO802_007738 [Lithocarpus litseifolius]|uniref:Equilibrative nucleoside transporter n=1 Tax=Lithocarpus litseifolius TaxID=425828 RepID=A0AAW2DPI4_9ROSI
MTIAVETEAPTRLEGKHIAMVVCFFLGLGSLVSWNSMLTIGDYYYQLFPKYHPSRVLTLVYQPFALGTMAILAFNESKINTRKRNIFGYTLFFASTLLVLVLDFATSGKGGIGPFIGLCVLSACFGVADAHVQGGMLGDLSFMCPEFIQSFLGGLAASGALASGLRLLTKVSFEKTHNGLRKGATLFLAISTFFEFLCILLYAIVFAKLPIVKYYRSKAASEGSKTVSSDLAAAGIQTNSNQGDEDDAKQLERLSNKQLFFQNIDYATGLFLIYVLTLSIFPGFLYENTGTHGLGSWYSPVLVAMYNVWDLISRYIPLIKSLKLESRKGLMIAILSRFLFIPAFYFCAKYGDKGWMILLTSLLGASNGYLTVCVLTVAPKGYKGPEQNALGNLLVLCVLCGLFAGVALDWLWLIGCGIGRSISVSDWLTKVRGARVYRAGDDVGAGEKLVGAMEMGRSMLTIGDYYYKLFPLYHPSRVLTLFYQPFAFGTMALLAYNESKIDTRWRNLIGYSLFFASTVMLIVLDLATSGKEGVGPYTGICAIVGSFGVADANVQGGMVGDLSFMHPELIQVSSAQWTLTSVIRIITKAAFEKSDNGLRKGAMLFLAISAFFEFLCVILYAFFFPKLPIVKYYRSKAASEGSKTVSADLAAAGIQVEADQEVLYPLVLIAMYSVWDFLSTYIPHLQCFKMESRKGLVIATLSRFLLIPAFYFTAKYGDQGWMIMFISFLGLSNGYLSVCIFTVAPKGYKGPEQNALGNLLVLCRLGGMFAGVALDWLWLIGHGKF